MYSCDELLDFSASLAGEYLIKYARPWEALDSIGEMILQIGKKLPIEDYDQIKETVWIAKDALVCPTAFINGPCIIGHRTEVRHCAFIRENALVGNECVVGNSVELKNAILFDGVQVPHFNYVGDSILGKCSHMGAGAVTSNVKLTKQNVIVRESDGSSIKTGLFKFGAILGDYVEVGCNSVLNPGTIIGRNSMVYPLSSVRGTVVADSIWKNNNQLIPKKK